MTVAELRPHWDAIVDHVDGLAVGFTVGDGARPAGDPPFTVLYLIDGGNVDGPVGDPEADLAVVVQATCVGRSQSEAAWVRDRVTRILRNHPLAVGTRTVVRVRTVTPGGVTRDDDHQPPLWYCTPRFQVATAPS